MEKCPEPSFVGEKNQCVTCEMLDEQKPYLDGTDCVSKCGLYQKFDSFKRCECKEGLEKDPESK